MRPESPEQPESLRRLQEQFFAALREPLSGSSRAGTWLPGAGPPESEAFSETANALIALGNLNEEGEAVTQPVERLELYHAHYWRKVMHFVSKDLPSLILLMGEADFWALFEAWHLEQGSESYSIRYLVRRLPSWLAEHPEWLGRNPQATLDCARMECALREIFEITIQPPLGVEQLPSLQAGTTLAVQPALRLLKVSTPVDLLRRNPRPTQCPQELLFPKEQEDIHLVLSRREGQVRVEREDPIAWTLLRNLRAGQSLEKALNTAQVSNWPRPEEALRQCFERWGRLGFFVSESS